MRVPRRVSDDSERQRLGGVDGLSCEQEVATTVEAEQGRPHDVHAVRGRQACDKVGGVLEDRALTRQNDIGQQREFGVGHDRAIDDRDHRDLDVKERLQHSASGGADPHPRRGRVGIDQAREASVVEVCAEAVTGTAEDDHLVVGIIGDVRKGEAEAVVRAFAKDEAPAVGMERHVQDAVTALETRKVVAVRVVVE